MRADPDLEPSPRLIPSSLRWRILLGGLLPVVGWSVLTLGGFMASAAVGNSELTTWWRTPSKWATARGTVLGHESTFIAFNGARMQRVEFEFAVDGQVHRGASFTASVPRKESATIEYSAEDPTLARVRGTRIRPFPAAVALMLVFPLCGLALVAAGVWLGVERLHLLRHGRFAWGVLSAAEATGGTINDRVVHKLAFAYVDDMQRQRVARIESHREHLRDASVARRVVYLPQTENHIVVEALPGPPSVDSAGRFEPMPAYEVVRVLALPIMAVVAVSCGALLWV